MNITYHFNVLFLLKSSAILKICFSRETKFFSLLKVWPRYHCSQWDFINLVINYCFRLSNVAIELRKSRRTLGTVLCLLGKMAQWNSRGGYVCLLKPNLLAEWLFLGFVCLSKENESHYLMGWAYLVNCKEVFEDWLFQWSLYEHKMVYSTSSFAHLFIIYAIFHIVNDR